jgi:CDP-diacylglycerol--glycerol-3-phosphate 3-phosphatidyltransferase
VNLPTQLTVGRICLVPLVVVFLISTDTIHALVAAVLFAGAALTDWLDGLIARRRGQVTTLGKLLDPVADKVLVSAALISLVQVGTIEAWMVVIMIGREFAVTGLRSVSAAQGMVIEASDLAKYKTFAQYLAVILLILERSIPTGLESEFVYFSRGALWAALILTIFSGIDYFVRFYRASDVRTSDVDSLARGDDHWR